MHTTEEIQRADLPGCSGQLTEAVEAICSGPAFRTSPKSCEFLRHIVHHTLADDTAQLKERLIGMALLGRQASYDTGTDAGVRVRANDVRKRLAAHFKAQTMEPDFLLELPSGSYVPRFFRAAPQALPAAMAPGTAQEASHRMQLAAAFPRQLEQRLPPPLPESAPGTAIPLSLQWLAAPTLIVFFLCTMCLRWQIAEEHPFINFWQKAFQNHHVTFYLSPSGTAGGESLVAMPEIKAADPLFDLAAQFHTQFLVVGNTSADASDNLLVSIGPLPGGAPGETNRSSRQARLTVADTPHGRRILDHGAAVPVAGPAALLTVFNGAHRSIQIDGTDTDAIAALVKILCARDSFPDTVADSLQSRAITQVVFPLDPNARTLTFHEPLPIPPALVAERTAEAQ